MTPQQFDIDVQKWIGKAHSNARAVVVESLFDIFEEVIRLQPVLSGNLRRSWFAAINARPSGTENGNDDAFAQVNMVYPTVDPGDIIYTSNFAAYSRRIELGFVGEDSLGRFYNQAGRHTVATALDRAPAIVADAARRVAKR